MREQFRLMAYSVNITSTDRMVFYVYVIGIRPRIGGFLWCIVGFGLPGYMVFDMYYLCVYGYSTCN